MRISDWSSDVCSSDLPKGTDGKVLHPIAASALKPVAAQFTADGKPFKMGMVFPVSTHNYELRYWLAAGGLNPAHYTPGGVGGTVKARSGKPRVGKEGVST